MYRWALLSLAVTPVYAQASYDSLSGGFESNLFIGHPFDGILIGGGYKEIASSFSVSQSLTLGSIDLALGITSGSGTAQVFLYADSGNEPGAILESFSITGIGTTASIFRVESSVQPLLTSGQNYWISVAAGAPDTDGTVCLSLTAPDVRVGFRGTPGGAFGQFEMSAAPAMRINSAVPEPASIGVLGIGLLALARRRRSSKGA